MMSNSLRLAAALLASLVLPTFVQAQTPAPSTPVPRSVPAPAAPTAPAVPRPAPAAAPAATGKRLDINSATASQLQDLPGIGPARATAIVAGRPYAEPKDLVAKKVLTQGVFDGIKDRIALANINTSSAAEMERTLKGIGDVRAKAIVAGRPYAAPQDLVTKKVLTQGVLDGMKDAITY
jgi:DNA uptake protein ComE-like DNA-binding protein